VKRFTNGAQSVDYIIVAHLLEGVRAAPLKSKVLSPSRSSARPPLCAATRAASDRYAPPRWRMVCQQASA